MDERKIPQRYVMLYERFKIKLLPEWEFVNEISAK
jgi:hypothetical protein